MTPVVDPASAAKGIPKLPSFGVTVVDAFEVHVVTLYDLQIVSVMIDIQHWVHLWTTLLSHYRSLFVTLDLTF